MRCFSSPGLPPEPMNSVRDAALRRRVAPFGDPGINDRSHLPLAYRSVPRPSSPLSAKASTRCPYLTLDRKNPSLAGASPTKQRRSRMKTLSSGSHRLPAVSDQPSAVSLAASVSLPLHLSKTPRSRHRNAGKPVLPDRIARAPLTGCPLVRLVCLRP